MKKILNLVLSLSIISAVCAAVLATVNAVTKDEIAQLKVRAKQNAARMVMPRSVTEVKPLEEGNDAILAGYAASSPQPIAFAVVGKSTHGYGGDIVLMVGFSRDLTILSYQKLEAAETPGLGSNLVSPEFTRQFKGMSAVNDLKVKKDGGEIAAITSATITSRAVCEAINNARDILRRKLPAGK